MPVHSRMIIFLAGTALLVLACMAAGCTSPPAPSATVSTQAPSSGSSTITIKNFAFDPPALTVKPGTTVTWVNQDSAPHLVVSDASAPAAFSSDQLSPGGSYSFTFTTPGTYGYSCSIHPSMKGTVIVQA